MEKTKIAKFFSFMLSTEEEMNAKDIPLIVNGLAKRLTPEQQTGVVLGLISYRANEIKVTQQYLSRLEEDRQRLLEEITNEEKNNVELQLG